jgi:hypothetical protein
MHEQEPQMPPTEQRWSSRQIAEALGVPARSQQSEQAGRGARYELSAETTLEVYPKAGLVRVSLPGASIELTGQEPPAVRDGSVIFKSELTRDAEPRELGLSVSRTGEVFFAYMEPVQPDTPSVSDAASEAPEHATAARPAAKRPENQSPQKSGLSSHPSAPKAIPTGWEGTKPERAPQIRLSGEVKRVSYREPTEPGKAPSLQLSVAYQEGERTRFIRVYTTKERARKLHDVAKIGDQIEIVGLVQQQTRRLPDGTAREETVIYALGIKKVNPEGTQP